VPRYCRFNYSQQLTSPSKEAKENRASNICSGTTRRSENTECLGGPTASGMSVITVIATVQ